MAKPQLTRERVQKLAANPGERSKLPTSLLQKYGLGDLARKRLTQQRLDTPVTPGSDMTNRDLAHEANAAVGLQYGPTQKLYQRQEQQIPGYYQAYADALKANQQGAMTQGAQSADAIKALYSSGPQAPGSAQSNVGQAQAGTAQLLGQAGANFHGALVSAAQSGALQALNAVKVKQADLAAQMGQANVQYRGKRRSDEVTNVATSALSGVKADTATAAQTTRDSAFLAKYGHTPGYAAAHPGQFAKDAATYTKKTAKPVADAPFKYGYTRKEWLALPLADRQRIDTQHAKNPKGTHADPTTGPGSVSSSQENTVVTRINKVLGMLQTPVTTVLDPNKNKITKPSTAAKVLADLKGQGVDPRILRVATSLLHNNGSAVGPDGVGAAHDLGIHVGGRWKVTAGPKTPAAAQKKTG